MRLITIPAALVVTSALAAAGPGCSASDSSATEPGPGGSASDGGATRDGSDGPAHSDGGAALDGASDGSSIVPDPSDAADGGSYVAWSCPAGPFGTPLPSGAHADLVPGVPPADGVVQGAGVLEGPAWLGGALYMTHFENHSLPTSRILRWTATDGVSIVNADAGANGLAIDPGGALLAAVHSDGSIARFDSALAHAQPLATSYAGARFDSPNDLTVRADGNVYFSDPDWEAPATHPQAKTRVYRVAPGGAVSVVDEDLDEPNGVTLSPDGAHLYVSGLSGVYAYDVSAAGAVSGKRAFAASLGGSDGMAIDCAGNLYVAYQTNVVVLAPSGTELGRIAVDGVQAVTNAAFGGVDRKTLFITSLGATQALHQVALGVPGLPY